MRMQRGLFYLCSALWLAQGWIWQLLNHQTKAAIFCFLVGIGCAASLNLMKDD